MTVLATGRAASSQRHRGTQSFPSGALTAALYYVKSDTIYMILSLIILSNRKLNILFEIGLQK
jgi:hypothetical protein